MLQDVRFLQKRSKWILSRLSEPFNYKMSGVHTHNEDLFPSSLSETPIEQSLGGQARTP